MYLCLRWRLGEGNMYLLSEVKGGGVDEGPGISWSEVERDRKVCERSASKCLLNI